MGAKSQKNLLELLYIRGSDWTDAVGELTNIRINEAAHLPNRGTSFSANKDLTMMVSATGAVKTLSFEYKILSGEHFNIALMPNWSAYYGYFQLTADGGSFNGVTFENLDDGYIRVTFDMAALTKINGTPTSVIEFMYLRGSWTDANGYIDNIQVTY